MAAQWSELEASAVLQAWRSSGVSIERFATARGITPQRIRWWKKKLEEAMPSRKTEERKSRGEVYQQRNVVPRRAIRVPVSFAGRVATVL